jgi:hypothetical protein
VKVIRLPLAINTRYQDAMGNPRKSSLAPTDGKSQRHPLDQWITVNTATRYVIEMHDKATDPAIKQNANETLAN